MPYENKVSEEELEEIKNRCWDSNCSKKSIFLTRGGQKYCWSHFWWQRDEYFSKMRKFIWKNLFK